MDFTDWPWQYSFPPFFTIQPNLETRDKQLKAWADLVLKYCKSNKKYLLDVRDTESSPLFNNTDIQRSLTSDAVLQIMTYLGGSKNAEPVDKTRFRWYILWHSVEEWASNVYTWAVQNGLVGSVCTLYEIINTDDQEFCGMDERVLLKVLAHLEKIGSAEIITLDDSKGVKFF